jgi:SAM-dependent methyltransferase
MDLGCGTGHDAASYAAAGHDVLGVDYSPTAVAMALEHTVDDPAVTVETFSLLDLRRLLSRGTRFALDHPGPRAVTGRLVLDALPADACNHVWWLSRTVLLGNGGSLFLEVRTHDGVPCGHRDGAPWQTQVSSQRLVEEVIAHGGHVEEMADAPAPEGDATGLTGTSRLRVSWPERL